MPISLNFQTLEIQVAQDQRKSIKRVRSKNISDKVAKRTNSTKQSIIFSISSTESRKLNNLIKYNNRPEVPLCHSFGPKPSQSEPHI